jgi:hypothetical protein
MDPKKQENERISLERVNGKGDFPVVALKWTKKTVAPDKSSMVFGAEKEWHKRNKLSRPWQCTPVISAIQEAETGSSRSKASPGKVSMIP